VSKSRREFLVRSTAMLASAAAAAQQQPGKDSSGAKSQQTPEGTPPAFGMAPAVGPEVDSATFAAAEKLVQVDLTEADRAMAAASWRNSMAALYERRVGPRKVKLSCDSRAILDLESRATRTRSHSSAGSIRAQPARPRYRSAVGCADRVRPLVETFALGAEPQAQLGAPD
jgi:hypothetical protein